ncbi:glutathione peroxidase [Sphingomonas sp.]|jgi:glutathione peroxidase|uniref:glutathione peroxidase n=1 Tax=Sphingomonas sp. TaxID=28214 RepID=UPI002DF52EF2|nr:glutathione peroxidase [Sphingomonas sp.]
MTTILNHEVKKPGGGTEPMSAHAGKVLLVVNVASKCGFTPQYAGLEALYRKYKDRGFEVLGFPCNQFGNQEPGDAQEIANFCSTTYDVTFPVFAKIEVNGPKVDPFFEQLKKDAPGIMGLTSIKWNFTKFLIDRNGNVVRRYAPTTRPEDIEQDIESLL